MPQLVMRGLTKVFRGGTVAVDRVDLSVDDGEFVVQVRPGDHLVLRPDLSALYFFDPVTTAALPAAHPETLPVAG